jgi:hypothetical protein
MIQSMWALILSSASEPSAANGVTVEAATPVKSGLGMGGLRGCRRFRLE